VLRNKVLRNKVLRNKVLRNKVLRNKVLRNKVLHSREQSLEPRQEIQAQDPDQERLRFPRTRSISE